MLSGLIYSRIINTTGGGDSVFQYGNQVRGSSLGWAFMNGVNAMIGNFATLGTFLSFLQVLLNVKHQFCHSCNPQSLGEPKFRVSLRVITLEGDGFHWQLKHRSGRESLVRWDSSNAYGGLWGPPTGSHQMFGDFAIDSALFLSSFFPPSSSCDLQTEPKLRR